jgi:uncharacterized membrane protein
MRLESVNPNLFDENASPVPAHVGHTAHRIGVALLLALIVLQFVWYLLLFPPERARPLVALAIAALPLIVPALFLLARAKKALFWAGFIAMFHFTHGVMEAWSVPAALWPGLLEAVLAAGLCCAAAWHGLSRRIYWRKLVEAQAASASE